MKTNLQPLLKFQIILKTVDGEDGFLVKNEKGQVYKGKIRLLSYVHKGLEKLGIDPELAISQIISVYLENRRRILRLQQPKENLKMENHKLEGKHLWRLTNSGDWICQICGAKATTQELKEKNQKLENMEIE